jgi:hypothetical protein
MRASRELHLLSQIAGCEIGRLRFGRKDFLNGRLHRRGPLNFLFPLLAQEDTKRTTDGHCWR